MILIPNLCLMILCSSRIGTHENVYPTPDLSLPSPLPPNPSAHHQLGSEASTPHPDLLPESRHQHHTTAKTGNIYSTLWHGRRTSAASGNAHKTPRREIASRCHRKGSERGYQVRAKENITPPTKRLREKGNTRTE